MFRVFVVRVFVVRVFVVRVFVVSSPRVFVAPWSNDVEMRQFLELVEPRGHLFARQAKQSIDAEVFNRIGRECASVNNRSRQRRIVDLVAGRQIAEKSPCDRVRELEEWGAVFDRTKDGRILQRNFGGHTYPRLAHVGDRTGLEMIRTLQDKGIHQGIDVHMECTITHDSERRQARVGCFGYQRESGRFSRVQGEGGRARDGRHRAVLGDYSRTRWEYTGDGHAMAYEAGADLIDMEFIQFHPTGMVWPPSVRGTLITEGVRGEGGVLLNSKGKRFMFDYIPDDVSRLSSPTTKTKAGRIHAWRQERTTAAGAADAR